MSNMLVIFGLYAKEYYGKRSHLIDEYLLKLINKFISNDNRVNICIATITGCKVAIKGIFAISRGVLPFS